MKIINHLITYSISIVAFAVIFSTTIFSTTLSAKNTDIYKWIDEEGRTNYTAKPGNESAQKMNIASRKFHDNKDEIDKKKSEERSKFCRDAKATLARYKRSPFLSRYDKTLKKNIRLTGEETNKAILEAEKDVTYWCSPPDQQDTTDKKDK